MTELTNEQAPRLAELFRNTQETLILSFVQGHHGRGWADRAENPRCAQVVVGDFCYFAGDASLPQARLLVQNRTGGWRIAVPVDGGWASLIEAAYRSRCRRSTRYQFQKNSYLDSHHLRRLIKATEPQYCIVAIDEGLYKQVRQHALTRAYVSNFNSCEDFLTRGIGFCALAGNGEIAGGASSYTVYDGGIEIEISTMPEHRRRGIAAACAAKLILTCKQRLLDPSWDAANAQSKALAEKLGYRLDYEYDAYIIEGEPI